MGIQDLHNNIKTSRGISPAAATTDNTAWVSQIVDTANFDATEFLILIGALDDADATFTTLVEEGDQSDLSDNSAVADADLLGDEGAGNGSFTFDEDNKVIKIGYRGSKRYARVTITPAANTGNAFVCGCWVQSGARRHQTAQQV